jgi:hypothetical protein
VVVSAVPPPTGLEPVVHIAKPFEMNQLLEAVGKAMPRP